LKKRLLDYLGMFIMEDIFYYFMHTRRRRGYIREIRKFFITHYKCLPQNVVELIGSNATFTNFVRTISDWEHKVTKNDIVFISLQGHGNVGIFEFNDRVVKYEEINEHLNKLQPMKFLIDIGACYGESAFLFLKMVLLQEQLLVL